MTERLLILQCGARKRPDAGEIPAATRYTGPLWQTLRTVDPEGSKAHVMVLSAEYGLIEGSTPIPNYDRKMDRRRAEAMAVNDMGAALAVLRRHGNASDICIVGGKHYVRVAEAFIGAAKATGVLGADATVTVVRDMIGKMRPKMRAWLEESRA